MHTDVEFISCPECGLPAELVGRVTLQSSDGPIEHFKTRCVTGRWFLTPIEPAVQDLGWAA